MSDTLNSFITVATNNRPTIVFTLLIGFLMMLAACVQIFGRTATDQASIVDSESL